MVIVHNNTVESVTPDVGHGVHIRDRMKRLEADPRRAESLKRARARLGGWIANEPSAPPSSRLAALRLKTGMSQQQLADALGTSQSAVARMEKGNGNHTMDVVRAWAKALGVTPNDLFDAFEACQKGSQAETESL